MTLLIDDRKKYPLGKSFPKSLKELTVKGIVLSKFDSRIINLHNLTSLTLQDNSFSSIPQNIETLALETLCLSNNALEEWPTISPLTPLALSLRTLVLSNNKITRLPETFWVFSRIITFNISRKRPVADAVCSFLKIYMYNHTNVSHLNSL